MQINSVEIWQICFKDDYEFCFKTFYYEMKLTNVIMANQGHH